MVTQGQLLASNTMYRNEQALVNKIEREASDRVSVLVAEVHDAAHEATILAFSNSDAARPMQISPASLDRKCVTGKFIPST